MKTLKIVYELGTPERTEIIEGTLQRDDQIKKTTGGQKFSTKHVTKESRGCSQFITVADIAVMIENKFGQMVLSHSKVAELANEISKGNHIFYSIY